MTYQYTADLSDAFFSGVNAMAQRQNLDAPSLMAIWYNESGIKPSVGSYVKDKNGKPVAYGINQILGSTLRAWGVDPDEFLQRPAEGQLPEIERYYMPYRNSNLNSIERMYQANFLPATLPWGSNLDLVLLYADPSQRTEHVGWIKPDTEALFYRSNSGLDHGKKGYITVNDLKIAASSHLDNPRVLEAVNRLNIAGPSSPPSSGGGERIGAVGKTVGVAIAAWAAWKIFS